MTNAKPLNIVLLGDPGTGKTNLLSRLTKNHFNPKYEPTIGINEITYDIHVGDQIMESDIWDLEGREKYRRLADLLLCDADGILLVYDVSNTATFENLTGWLRHIRQAASPKTVIKLVGNKNDLQSMVSRKKAEQFAADNNLSYIETSALNNSHVHLAFESIAQEIDVATHSVSEPPFSSVEKESKASSDDDDQQEKPFQIVLIDIIQAADKTIVCVEKPLEEDNLKFIAISYRWGEVQEQVIDTKLGYMASVTSFALDDFYKLCFNILIEPDLQSIKYVWVDAICVDQNNHARRKATIYQMSNIYHRAAYILAVPDLHLEYLRSNQIYTPELRHTVRKVKEYKEFIYYLLQEKTDQLVQITEKWFDEMKIPKATMTREKLTGDIPREHFTNFLDVYNVQDTDSLCDEFCLHNCFNLYGRQCHYTPKSMLDHIQYSINECHGHSANTTIVHENNDCALCSLQMDMCNHQRKGPNKNEITPGSNQKWLACVLRELQYDKYRRLITNRIQAVAKVMNYLEYLIKDWSSRVWVISEYNIAKAKQSRKMKFWFLSLGICVVDARGQSFFEFDFDKLNTNDFVPKGDSSLNCIISEAKSNYYSFQETLISQLNERSFLEMMLTSKASRNEDRFYAIFPSTKYKNKLTSREVVSSWKIDNIVSVKLKLFELMTTKDKLKLLCWMAYSFSDTSESTFPAFANINTVKYKVPPIEERNAQYYPCNFDLNSNTTLRLVPPMDNEYASQFHKLNLLPKMYYVLRGQIIFNRSRVYDKRRFRKTFDINYPDDDLTYVMIPMYMYTIDRSFDSTEIVLFGSFKKNKWLLCGNPIANLTEIYCSKLKDYDNSDGNISFDIY